MLPTEILNSKAWVLWKKKTRAGGRVAKIPFCAESGRKAKVSRPSDWTDYETARRALEVSRGFYDGLGFCFSGGIVGIDLDNKGGHQIQTMCDCFLDWRRFVDGFGSFTEVSQSGTGLHILVKGALRADILHRVKLSKGELEIYDQGRFFALTGNVPHGAPVQLVENQYAIDALTAWLDYKAMTNKGNDYKALPYERNNTNVGAPSDKARLLGAPSVALILRRAAKDARFNALYSGIFDGDQSRADLALCAKLAFYTQRDPVLMDSVFRASALMRAKWNKIHVRGKTYGQATIEKALASSPNVWGRGA